MRPGVEKLLPLIVEAWVGMFGLTDRKAPAWLGLEKLLPATPEACKGVLRLPDRTS